MLIAKGIFQNKVFTEGGSSYAYLWFVRWLLSWATVALIVGQGWAAGKFFFEFSLFLNAGATNAAYFTAASVILGKFKEIYHSCSVNLFGF